MISLLLNILWIIFGGLPMAFGWLVAALMAPVGTEIVADQ